MERPKIWSDHKTIMRLAIQHLKEWQDQLTLIGDSGNGNINAEVINDIADDLLKVIHRLESFEVKCQSLQVPPKDF